MTIVAGLAAFTGAVIVLWNKLLRPYGRMLTLADDVKEMQEDLADFASQASVNAMKTSLDLERLATAVGSPDQSAGRQEAHENQNSDVMPK